MTDYTPTTEEVRDAATTDYREEDITQHQFDRWLAEVKAQAWDEGYVSSDDYYGEHDNPYRQGEGSDNSSSQPTAETSNLLNKQG